MTDEEKELAKMLKAIDREDRDMGMAIVSLGRSKNIISEIIKYIERNKKVTLENVMAFTLCYGRDDLD